MPKSVELIVGLKSTVWKVQEEIDFRASNGEGYRIPLLKFLPNGLDIRHMELSLNLKSPNKMLSWVG